MRKGIWLSLVVGLSISVSAQGATLTMSFDNTTYSVGDTITLTVTGDSQGASDIGIFGTVEYDSTLVSANGGQTQSPLTSFDGGLPWVQGMLFVDLPHANTQDAFNQIGGLVAVPVDQLLIAVMTFHAAAPGIANFGWFAEERLLGGSVDTLHFFGLTNASGGAVTIRGPVAAVPEPTTASLLALGLVGLTIAGRRRS
jgi:hypothetical protein